MLTLVAPDVDLSICNEQPGSESWDRRKSGRLQPLILPIDEAKWALFPATTSAKVPANLRRRQPRPIKKAAFFLHFYTQPKTWSWCYSKNCSMITVIDMSSSYKVSKIADLIWKRLFGSIFRSILKHWFLPYCNLARFFVCFHLQLQWTWFCTWRWTATMNRHKCISNTSLEIVKFNSTVSSSSLCRSLLHDSDSCCVPFSFWSIVTESSYTALICSVPSPERVNRSSFFCIACTL